MKNMLTLLFLASFTCCMQAAGQGEQGNNSIVSHQESQEASPASSPRHHRAPVNSLCVSPQSAQPVLSFRSASSASSTSSEQLINTNQVPPTATRQEALVPPLDLPSTRATLSKAPNFIEHATHHTVPEALATDLEAIPQAQVSKDFNPFGQALNAVQGLQATQPEPSPRRRFAIMTLAARKALEEDRLESDQDDL